MKRMILLSIVGVSALAVYALAQGTAGTPEPSATAQAQPAESMMARCRAMMQGSGMDRSAMRCMRAMMQAPIFPDSPSALYGRADDLGLSDEQKARLMEIETEARPKALAVLTDEQRKKVGDIPDKPATMMQMCQQMCGEMKPQMPAGGRGRPMMMCPMMERMRGETGDKGGATTKAAE